jgi:hypothetical protein
MVVLVLANVAVFTAMALRPSSGDSYGPTRVAAASSPAGEAAPSPVATAPSAAPAPVVAPVLAVYGDGYAAGNASGGLGPAGWPVLVADATGAELSLHAVARAGYASVGVTGEDIPAAVRANPVPEAAVTVLFGSRNDAGEAVGTVQANAAAAIAAVLDQAPDTELVVIGPVWSDGNVPAGVIAARDAVRSAAQVARVTFVDPVADEWFADVPGLIAADGVSPTDQGHAYLAQQIEPLVSAALAQSGAGARPTA